MLENIFNSARVPLLLLVTALLVSIGYPLDAVQSQSVSEPKPLEPRRAILDMFEKYPLVAISEAHGMKEQADFIASLIRHPQFAQKVNDIVLEAGNAKYQDILGRYTAGGPVPIDQLRLLWREHTCSALGPRDSTNLEMLLATVRDVNKTLPPGKRLRVLAGDPPIDWSKVHSAEDLSLWLARREIHYARVVEKQVLAAGRKALLIIGGLHLERGPLKNNDPKLGVMQQILESKYPGKTFIVFPHEGFNEAGGKLEERMASWSRPSLILLKGTWLGDVDTGDMQVLDVMIDSDGRRVSSGPARKTLADKADAYLYLGPGRTLTMEPRDPALFLDDEYFNELNRRYMLAQGRPLDRSELIKPRLVRWRDNFQADTFLSRPPETKQIIPFDK